ncbi:MAG: Recombination protein RecR [Candidatus Magasanikbacteria bacterium GW2011_GWA2_45_39]|uniref:Recombination protein RecR n=2 Tax=Candidatus Magasanikiibacteriota TaxID=1752731 RepID=A0A0G1MWI1_9BACT|nr:MAG: Recombination protein RecR [Candidatus Magasanikbacteria bacterium GW2011_GWA2_45_39]KKU12661.1 MAG: Recombination protein RecR [Candidatus Magasanikbacteria bacterium GW2011_GWC2_45_8]HBW74012.1 recombination protein RecR [Candidatus Magasanikbacteria bacterium]
MTSQSIQQLIEAFQLLPGVGPKTAERYAFYLVRTGNDEITEILDALNKVRASIVQCAQCFNFAEISPCEICSSPKRDKTIVCVVSHSADVVALEKTGSFNGVYHILGGTLNAIEGVRPEHLKIKELTARARQGVAKELIIALNADMEGETTSLYLVKLLQPLGIRLTRLARGLPMGSDIQYADELTLANALNDRKNLGGE